MFEYAFVIWLLELSLTLCQDIEVWHLPSSKSTSSDTWSLWNRKEKSGLQGMVSFILCFISHVSLQGVFDGRWSVGSAMVSSKWVGVDIGWLWWCHSLLGYTASWLLPSAGSESFPAWATTSNCQKCSWSARTSKTVFLSKLCGFSLSHSKQTVSVLGICSPSSVSSRDRQYCPPKYCSLLLSGERNISAEKSTSGNSFCEWELQGRILKSAPTRGTATQQAQHDPPHTQEV